MLPLAPVRFSTTTDWPRRAPSRSATTRALVSVTPPGANGTTRRSGRAGQSCACAPSAARARRAAPIRVTGSLSGPPGADRFLELLVAVDVAGTRPAVDPVEGRKLGVEPVGELLVARVRGLVRFVDQHEMDARVVRLLGAALGLVALEQAKQHRVRGAERLLVDRRAVDAVHDARHVLAVGHGEAHVLPQLLHVDLGAGLVEHD